MTWTAWRHVASRNLPCAFREDGRYLMSRHFATRISDLRHDRRGVRFCRTSPKKSLESLDTHCVFANDPVSFARRGEVEVRELHP